MLTVSNYHYIRPQFEAKFPSIFGMTPEQFENQLQLLKNDAEFIHPTDLLNNLERVLSSKENYCLVTFDDGLKEQYQYALPILDNLEIPAIFFANSINFEEKKVTTVHKIHLLRSELSSENILHKVFDLSEIRLSNEDQLQAKKVYRFDSEEAATLKYLLNFKMSFDVQEKFINNLFQEYFDENHILQSLYMTTEQIMALASRGYLGSHTHTHYPLGLLDSTAMQFELENSKFFFESLTNTKIEMVAYPYGTKEAATLEVARIAENVGYKIGFTTHKGTNDLDSNPLLFNRFDCNDLVGGKFF